MANYIAPNSRLFILDTVGFFWNKPIIIKTIVYVPNGAGDAATLSSYNPQDTVRSTRTGYTMTVSTSNTLTYNNAGPDATPFATTAKLVSGDMLIITMSDLLDTAPTDTSLSEDSARPIPAANYGPLNLGTFIATRTSDTVAVLFGSCHAGGVAGGLIPLTDDASGVYSWKTIAPYTSVSLLVPATEKQAQIVEFHDKGMYLPNLALTAITSSTGKIYIYYV